MTECHTSIERNDGTPGMCGHSITSHEGDESGMGGPEPCMTPNCPCENYTRKPEAEKP